MLHDWMWFNTAVWLIMDIGGTFSIDNIDNEPLYQYIYWLDLYFSSLVVALYVMCLLLDQYEG